MKLLIIAQVYPYPPQSGGKIRLYNLIKHLSKKHEVDLLVLMRESEPPDIEAMKKYCTQVDVIIQKFNPNPKLFNRTLKKIYQLMSTSPSGVILASSAKMQKIVRAKIQTGNFDIVQIEGIGIAQYRPSSTSCKTILSLYDLYSVIFQRLLATSSFLRKLDDVSQYFKYRRYERQVCPLFDACLTMSEVDAEQLKKISPNSRIFVIPNGVDIEYFYPVFNNGNTKRLVFTGTMSYSPNHDGMLYFYHEIFHKICSVEKQVQLYIVGMEPPQQILDLGAAPNIEVTGRVEDVRHYIADASVYIAPLRIGSGTRLKILEALAMGKAVVSTSIGCEGISVTHEKNIIIADEPSDFARWCIELLRNPDLRKELGQEGRKLVEEKYSWETICASLEKVYEKL